MRTNRGLIDEDVDAAKFRQGARHHSIDLLFLGDIGKQRQGLAAAGADLQGDCVCLALVGAGVDDDVGPFCSQLQYCGTANIPPRAGDQGNFAIELTHQCFLLEFCACSLWIGARL